MARPPQINVHILYDYAPEIVAELQGQLDPRINLTTAVNPDGLARGHILVGGRPSREQLQASPDLQALVVPWAGLPPETRALLADFPGISVHNLHHNAHTVAEHTLALLLAAAKRIVPYDQALRRGDWSPRYAQPRRVMLLEHKTALILGYGAIGRRVAHLCRALDMRVLATRRTPPFHEVDGPAEIHPPEALPELLPQANALIVALPQTPETEDLLGAAELASLPPESVLVNIGRGPIVNERALYEALAGGRLGAAALDVWYQYPADEAARTDTPPSAYPFAELDNVVLSPHRAGHAVETEALRMAHLAQLLNHAAAGMPLPNRVDLQKGY